MTASASPINSGADGATTATQHTEQDATYLPTQFESSKQKKIFILGGEQCVGLSRFLIESRSQTPYEKYQICSFVKPGASTEEILKTSSSYNISRDDFVILSVGQNDRNPTNIMMELSAAIKNLKCNVIILRTQHSLHLNEYKLNQMLKLLAKNAKECTFLDLYYSNVTNYRNLLCRKINNIIDQIYYDKTFLNVKTLVRNSLKTVTKRQNRNKTNVNMEPRYLKGTIPYFFEKMRQNTKTNNLVSMSPDKKDTFFRP